MFGNKVTHHAMPCCIWLLPSRYHLPGNHLGHQPDNTHCHKADDTQCGWLKRLDMQGALNLLANATIRHRTLVTVRQCAALYCITCMRGYRMKPETMAADVIPIIT